MDGTLIAIGGAEDRTGERRILQRFVEVAGGLDARVLIATCGTEEPDEVAWEYSAAFRDLGVTEIHAQHVADDREAREDGVLELNEWATGIFFTGGDQGKIASSLCETPVHELLRARFAQDGLVVAGTSAGASVLCETMLLEGEARSHPTRGLVRLAAGLGLVPDVIIDQHFTQRGRIGRLLAALAGRPELLGIGIDEDTAIELRGERMRAIGSGAVTVLDPGAMRVPTLSDEQDDALEIHGVVLYVLPDGASFDLFHRRPASRAA